MPTLFIQHHIDQFVLVTDRDADTSVLSNVDANDICAEVTSATGIKSIDAKIKLIGYTEDELKLKIEDIISKASIQKYSDIDLEIEEGFADYFIRLGVNEATYFLRIKQLIQQVTVDILDSVAKGQPYKLSYDEVCQMKNCIIIKITDDKWEPSYAQFRKLRKVSISDLGVIKTREYQQLKECSSLTNDDISRHLQYGEYYVNSKRYYYERGLVNIVNELENTA